MTPSMNMQRDVWSILGLPFDAVSLQQAVDHCLRAIECEQYCFLSTPNLNFVIACQDDDAFFESVLDSDLSIADGMPLVWVARLLGIPVVERVAGSTLFEALSQKKGLSRRIKVFFFGGQQGVAAQAHQKLNEADTAMESCGFYDPGFVSVEEMSTPEIIAHINRCQPDFLVVALGAKKGQQWIQKNRHHLHAHIISHLGAVINFVAGHVDRAPLRWQRLGLEWLWRIRQEPDLWRRYFFDGLAFCRLLFVHVLPLALYDCVLKKRLKGHAAAEIKLDYNQDNIVLTVCGQLCGAGLHEVKSRFDQLLQQEKCDIVLDCTQLNYVDAAFIGSLLLFQRCLNLQGRQLKLDRVSPGVKRLLFLHQVSRRFQLVCRG